MNAERPSHNLVHEAINKQTKLMKKEQGLITQTDNEQ